MPDRFFGRAFEEGAPISRKGFARGIRGMSHALDKMSVYGGRVVWSSDNVPKIIAGAGGEGTRLSAFEVISVGNDVLTCAAVASIGVDGWPVPVAVEGEEEETTFEVAKPWILRRTPFDTEEVDGITYTYTSATERTAATDFGEETEETEDQIITPVYIARTESRAGELIYAAQSAEGWVDINHAGRCWAAIEPEDTEEIPAEDLEPADIMTIAIEEA